MPFTFSHRISHFPAYSSVNVANRLTSSHRKPQAIPKGGIVIRANLQSNQANGSGDSDWAKPLMNFASKNFLPLALVGGVALGLANPTLGCLADSYNLSKFSTFGIFAIAGLTLCTEEIGATTEVWHVGLFGLVSILLLTPLFSRLIMQLHLQPQEFITENHKREKEAKKKEYEMYMAREQARIDAQKYHG
ncbi:hypothetical protein POM88_020428 [Heracleum sosnowskyi]|uniref:Uncharacterized protein n=1 Tax=Heracleum sosnowskyi TaxID=360622 RepID=A0AAD8IE30_9APIA|nr:hypothetical protein POM88_020428 [Heracleum sosnowskyi]